MQQQALDVRVHKAMVDAIRRVDREGVLQKFNDLTKEVIECQRCQLGKHKARAIPGIGPAHACVMFVGEAPSAVAELYGRPFPLAPTNISFRFRDESGDILKKWLDNLGLPLEWMYITNLVKCRKIGNGPAWDEIRACAIHLQKEIELIQPKLVVALGAYAVRNWFSTPARMARISEVSGKPIVRDGIIFFPLWHPSMFARGGVAINISNDLTALRKVLESLF